MSLSIAVIKPISYETYAQKLASNAPQIYTDYLSEHSLFDKTEIEKRFKDFIFDDKEDKCLCYQMILVTQFKLPVDFTTMLYENDCENVYALETLKSHIAYFDDPSVWNEVVKLFCENETFISYC